MKKHGAEKRRTWRKLHLAVDVDTHEAFSAEVSLVNVGYSEVLPTLLNPLRRKPLPYLPMEPMTPKIAMRF